MSVKVRRATVADAVGAADVIRRSIAILCREDYRGDPEILARWTANKTAENLERWIADPNGFLCVAIGEGDAIAAVGSTTNAGEIQLNYVAPEFRFTGASKAVVAFLENHLLSLGISEARLSSTSVARRFYRSLGYREGVRIPSPYGTVDGWEMLRRL